jgi:hypothetical protein
MSGFIFFMAQLPLVGQTLLIIEAAGSQSDTPHAVGLLWTRPVPDNIKHSKERETDSHAQGRIRT